MKITLKSNFDFDIAVKALDKNTQKLVNDIGKQIKDAVDNNINAGAFQPLSDATKKLHGGHRPLHLTGKLAKSNKFFPAKGKSLIARIKNVAKSTKSYKVFNSKGKIYRGKRNKSGEFYGYYQNEGFKTAPNSLIPNRTVPKREFFEIEEDKLLLKHHYDRFVKRVDVSMKTGRFRKLMGA